MYNDSTGQVLGASTAVGGIMSLPYTGNYLPALVLSYIAILFGAIVLLTLITTRVIKYLAAR